MAKGQTVLIVDPETDFLEWAVKQLTAVELRVISSTRSDDALRLAQRERPIHLSKFPILATVPVRFRNGCETSELFRLCSDKSLSATARQILRAAFLNAQVQTSVPRSAKPGENSEDQNS